MKSGLGKFGGRVSKEDYKKGMGRWEREGKVPGRIANQSMPTGQAGEAPQRGFGDCQHLGHRGQARHSRISLKAITAIIQPNLWGYTVESILTLDFQDRFDILPGKRFGGASKLCTFRYVNSAWWESVKIRGELFHPSQQSCFGRQIAMDFKRTVVEYYNVKSITGCGDIQ